MIQKRIYRPATCGHCGAAYTPSSGHQKRCGDCRKAFNAADHIARQASIRRAAGAVVAREPRACVRCSETFQPRAHNTLCCAACRPLHQREKNQRSLAERRRKAGQPSRGAPRLCVECGLPYSYRGGPQVRCHSCRTISNKAYAAAYAKARGRTPGDTAYRREWRHTKDFGEGNRKAAIARDDFHCRRCGSFDTLHVHHIDNAGKGLPVTEKNNALANLITLCGTCHKRLHVATERLLYERHGDTVLEALGAFLAHDG